MGEPTIVVLPGENGGHTSQSTAQISSTIQRALHESSHPKSEPDGPLKQVLAHQDSLYKYINWEDPVRTLGAYIGSLSILFGAHYLPLTQWALKAGMTIFGVVSVTEFASRSFSSDSLSTRLRPRKYKTFPESTLNATLKDVHDLVQNAAVQAQRIVFGQDLSKTFAAFLGFTALYGLVQVLNPFWLTVLALTSVFVAPLFTSPQGRKIAQDASERAQELANATADKSKELAQNGQIKASELSSKAQEAVHDAGNTLSSTAQSGKQTAADLSARARDTASDLSGIASENARSAGNTVSNTAQSGKQTAVDLSSKAKGTASDLSGAAAENARNVGNTVSNTTQSGKQTAADLSTRARNTASDLSGAATENARSAGNTVSDTAHSGKQAAADLSTRARGTASDLSGAAAEDAKYAGSNLSNAAQSGKRTAAGISSQARDKASDASGYAAENVGKLPQVGANVLNKAQGSATSTLGDTKQYFGGSDTQNYTHEPASNSSHKYSHNVEATPGKIYERDQAGHSTNGSVHKVSGSAGLVVEPPRLSAADEVNRRAV